MLLILAASPDAVRLQDEQHHSNMALFNPMPLI
jgi:hypothetical protein